MARHVVVPERLRAARGKELIGTFRRVVTRHHAPAQTLLHTSCHSQPRALICVRALSTEIRGEFFVVKLLWPRPGALPAPNLSPLRRRESNYGRSPNRRRQYVVLTATMAY
ncbi:unnamed protein product, partial [Iphiclides podalirius]